VYVALDFFDASINRIEAWVIGTRGALKSALFSLLEPIERVKAAEDEGRLGDRLALQEEAKTLPFGAVWNEFCRRQDVPAGADWISDVARYEQDVLSTRGKA
ncbi:MAG: L-rhamnose isomerase, partial [Spirochaetota bacterium]